ncbi:MAG: DNA-directed RNA polymerase subunit omega [Candidatus Eisenbacteria bacterium]|uniref:DNA-directed RNA polymerase subunit omega n=1 Tax=Eiseniibacteriota bacterium TaxID=2212470 RepID=A0A538T3X3_UNCEI|nr:MAG: DNA-directed RNA polymerase subunit omega [Candidatus Eisenbacteria bacterium]
MRISGPLEVNVLDEKGVLRSSNIPNKYELIIVAAKEARRLNELSRQTGLNLGGKVTNVALEEALKGNVLYRYRTEAEELKPEMPESAEE